MPDPNVYTVGWICALFKEFVAARAFLDEVHEGPRYLAQHDNNTYSLGRIGDHNVVIAVVPDGEYGTASAAGVARDMLYSFPNIRISLMVGVGSGAPTVKHDVRLGDIVVSTTRFGYGGVFQYDFGKTTQLQEFQASRFLNQPPTVLRTAVSQLKAQYEADGHQIQEAIQSAFHKKPRLRQGYSQPDPSTDRLYRADVIHPLEAEAACLESCGNGASMLVARRARDELEDNPTIHYGLIASGNQSMKDASLRDKLAQEKDVLCFETEAAGLMNHFPCIVIRGICDYADTHKNKQWQGYAAMTAAAYAKAILERIAPDNVEAEMKSSGMPNKTQMDISVIQGQESETKTYNEELRANNYNKIKSWLASPDPSTNFNKARREYQRGTGQWLLESEVYTQWKTKRSSFLWIHGIPGCGKTILSSSIVADLERSAGSARNVLYFYFDFNDVDKQSLDKAVRSLIHQLYFKRDSARKEVDDLYSSCDNGRRQPDQKSLLALFLNMLQHQRDTETWIILDALDECNTQSEGTTFGLMLYLRSLRGCTTNLHLLATSRTEHDIQSAIESWARHDEIIPLQNARVEDDINIYIKAKVLELTRWKNRPGIQSTIETVLSNKSNGMFRWVSCQFDTLSKCLDPESINRELAILPRTLDETYDRILESIEPSRRRSAMRLLQFLTYSHRPLRLEEAVDAVAVNTSKTPCFDPEYRMPCPEEIVGYCSSLAVLVKRKDERDEAEIIEIQLAHLSVQEYLRSDRLQGDIAAELRHPAAIDALTRVCLSYLLSLDQSSPPNETRKEFPLAQYSAQYWPKYAAVAEQSYRSALPLVTEYFSSITTMNFCCRIYDPDQPWADDRDGPEKPPNALYYASLTGLTYAARALVDDGANVNAQVGQHGNALWAAVFEGHEDIVRVLIENGAEVNAQNDRGFNALQLASGLGHPGIVQLLIDWGTDVNAQGGQHSNALLDAIDEGHQKIVQILVDNGAEVNAQGGLGDNALQNASSQGHKEIVQLLLDHGADVNAQGGEHGNALQAATYNGHQEIVQLLIAKGANLNAQDEGGSALLAASTQGHQEIVRLLIAKGANIDSGADINARAGYGNTALQLASAHGHEEIAKMLIYQGADVNAQGGYFENALNAASRKGHKAIVHLLLHHGADVNIEGRSGNALQAASVNGHLEIVQLLLDNGADVNASGGRFGKAIEAALYKGHQRVVQLLAEKGAYSQDSHSESSASLSKYRPTQFPGNVVTLEGFSDSGYRTMTVEGSEFSLGKAVLIAENPETPSKDQAILEFVSNLSAQVCPEIFSDQASNAVLEALPKLLEAFADRVGYGSSSSWCCEVRTYFHKYRE